MSEASLADDVRALLVAARGAEPGKDAVEALGGWARIAAAVRDVADDPVLIPLVRLVARDGDNEDAVPAFRAVVDTVFATTHALSFADCIEALVSSPAVVSQADYLHDAALDLVGVVAVDDAPDEHQTYRAAYALEAATRLAVGGLVSEFALHAQLDKFRRPVGARLGVAVVRSVGAAIDQWAQAAPLEAAVRAVAGITSAVGAPVAGADEAAIESDATWTLANVALVTALRARTPEELAGHLDRAIAYADTASTTYDRDDAAVLAPVLKAVRALITQDGPSLASFAQAEFTTAAVERVVSSLDSFTLTVSGLDHWVTTAKARSLTAWVNLLTGLRMAADAFSKAAFYDPASTVANLLDVYKVTRSVAVVSHDDDLGGVLELVQPVIESGFASKEAFVSQLADHVDDLNNRLAARGHDDALVARRDTAVTVLDAARDIIRKGADPGKEPGGGGPGQLLAPLEPIFAGTPHAGSVAALGEPVQQAIVDALANQKAVTRPSIVALAVRQGIVSKLVQSPDYTGDVTVAVDTVLDLLLAFVRDRSSAEPGRKPYLFNPRALEGDLQNDLYEFLIATPQIGSAAELEVKNVGGGRVDIRIPFDGFNLVLELKLDGTQTPMTDKTAYLKQAASYQANDVRIGFVVALRTAAFPSGPTPHLGALFDHAVFEVEGEGTPRHIVLVQVPGNRTPPSGMKAR